MKCKMWGKQRHTVFQLCLFLNFIFYVGGVQLINNVAIVSGVQQRDSVMHIRLSILFQVLFPFRLLHYVEQSFLCYTAGPCWLSVLMQHCVTVHPNSLTIPSPHFSPLVIIISFSKSVSLFLFCKSVHSYHFLLDSLYYQYHMIFLSLSGLLHQV